MRQFFILMQLLAASLHPSPIEVYMAKNAYIYKEFTLSPEDNGRLSMLVTKNENLQQLVKGNLPFDTSFLKKYKGEQSAIVKNYLQRMDMKVLGSIHNILGFFYDKKGQPIALGPALTKLMELGIDIKECMYEILVWWLDSTPGGKLNANAMLTRLQGGALDAELNPFLIQTATSIRRYDPKLLREIEVVIKTAQEDFDAFPDQLYTSLLRLTR